MITIENFEVIPVKGLAVATINKTDVDIDGLALLASIPDRSVLDQLDDVFYANDVPILKLEGIIERVFAITMMTGGDVSWARRCCPVVAAIPSKRYGKGVDPAS